MTIVTAASSPRSFCATNVSFQVLDYPRDCVDPVVDFSTDFISMPIRGGALHVLRARAAPPKGPEFCFVQLEARAADNSSGWANTPFDFSRIIRVPAPAHL